MKNRHDAHIARPRCPRSSGFTMIELLVTMLILAVALTGLAALQVATIRNVTSSKRANEAVRLAASIVERYRNMGNAGLTGELAGWTAGTWEIHTNRNNTQMVNVGTNGEGNGPYTVKHFLETINTNPLITIRVEWQSLNRKNDPGDAEKYETYNIDMTCRRY